jgi:hypothetical protein
MIKRLCFDTESDYYKGEIWILTVEDHREHMQKKILQRGPIVFQGGVVCNEASGQYYEFRSDQASELILLLGTADELVSHSGLRHDLLVLEQVCGPDAVSALWSIPHRDLLDMHSYNSVESLARQFVPHRFEEAKASFAARLVEIQKNYPSTSWGPLKNHQSPENIQAGKLAKARYDVELTLAIFLACPAGTR